MKDLARAIRDGDSDRAEDLVDEIIRGRMGGVLDKFEDLPGVGSDMAKNIQMHGYNTLDKLAEAPLEDLVKIPELSSGKAKEVFESAQNYLEKKFTDLPGVGEDTAKEIVKKGYTSIGDLARSSVKELTEIPMVGKSGAEKIHEYAESEAGTELEDLPGVGRRTAEEMARRGFTAMGAISESSVEKISEIPNIGERGADKILEYAKENPQDEIEDLPGVGEETAKEIRKHGYTAMRRVAGSSVEELSEIPNIGKKGAKEILDYARGKFGGRVEDLPDIDEETAEEIKKHGYFYVEDIAKSSVKELVKVPGLREGKAKEVSESAEEILRDAGGSGHGYIHALNGIISGLDPEEEHTLPRRISEGFYSVEELEKIKSQMEDRASEQFRPSEERRFNEAWSDILTALIEIEENDE